jgi:hypothetical protein
MEAALGSNAFFDVSQRDDDSFDGFIDATLSHYVTLPRDLDPTLETAAAMLVLLEVVQDSKCDSGIGASC